MNSLANAYDEWRSGDALAAGEAIWIDLEQIKRIDWAKGILAETARLSRQQFEVIDMLLSLGDSREELATAKSCFSFIRRRVLEVEAKLTKSLTDDCLVRLLYLAENVAKVLYNESQPSDEFDDDVGWWVVKCARDCAEYLDENAAKAIWDRMNGN